MTAISTMATIQDFLAQRRLALVGLSTHPDHFSHAVFKELVAHGYDVVPVHPTASELEGRPVVHHLAELSEPVDAALIMTPAEHSAEAVQDALAAGVKRIWLHRGAGQGAVSEEALNLCENAQVALVPGECPLMFLREGSWVHRLHAWGRKVTGTWPE